MKDKNMVESWHGHHFNVLGEEYTFMAESKDEEKEFEVALAFADFFKKRIVFNKECKYLGVDSLKSTIRHELIHCFLYESGLDSSSDSTPEWARNEEMVDWLAIQSPKIFKLFKEHDLL